MKFLVKREDTGKVIRLELNEDQQVFDLLEAARSHKDLKFSPDATLCLHPEGNNKILNEADCLSKLKDIGILVVKDRGVGKKRKNDNKKEKKVKEKENMAKATKTRENIIQNMEHDGNINGGDKEFDRDLHNQKPADITAAHKTLNDLKLEGQENSPVIASCEVIEKEELEFLNKKLKAESIEGFVYEIIPEEYVDHNSSTYREFAYSSEEERRESQSKVTSTTNWSSWNAEAGFSGWGVSVSASGGQEKSASQDEGQKSEQRFKTKTAIVTRTGFHQMKKFRVRVRLNDKAVKDVKSILEAEMNEKRQAINAFNKKYCSFIYTGQFIAGGWFRTIATATSLETMEFSALAREATLRTENQWAAAASGYGMTAGGGQDTGNSSQESTQQSQENHNSSVQVTIRKESSPGNTSNENDLENKVKNPVNWTVFPKIGARKENYTQIYEILKIQAEETGDKKLDKAADIMRLYMKGASMGNMKNVPYVVLIGDVGSGKSTIVEKLTGEKGRSSSAQESFTKTSEPFWVPDGSLIISDTPGTNSMRDKLEHNVCVAGAVNFMPVYKIFIIVKADTRIDNVVDDARKYAERFMDLPSSVWGVLVTHMDTVGWSKDDFKEDIDSELGIDTVIFSSLQTPREVLLRDIQMVCKEKHNLTVDKENFLKLFKIHNSHVKILSCTEKAVDEFKKLKTNFDEVRQMFSGKDQVDLIFEFQAWMGEQITEAQKKLAKDNNFTFFGKAAANEAGHVANMTNQLRAVLYGIRIEAIGFQSEHGVSELKKCPHCGEIWAKIEGCDGDTTCGERPSTAFDIRSADFGVLGTFTFKWLKDSLKITKNSTTKKLQNPRESTSSKPVPGCGKTINWKEMATVQIPAEFREGKISTEDVKVLPPAAYNFSVALENKIGAASGKMKLGNKPS